MTENVLEQVNPRGSAQEIAPGIGVAPDEIHWRFSRSGGPGGQNVNKVETRVELLFAPGTGRYLTTEQRDLICASLKSRLDADGFLHVVSAIHRTQRKNRDAALARLGEMLTEALRPARHRRPTRTPRGEKLKRLENKRIRGGIKQHRKWQPGTDD